MGSPVASVEIQAKSTGLRAQLREARAQFGTFAREVGSVLKRSASFAYQGAFGAKRKGRDAGFLRAAGASAVGNIAAQATSRAVDFATDMGRSVMDFEGKLTRLQIQGNKTPEVMRAMAKEITAASNATGIGRDQILSGAVAFTTLTGEMDIARESAGVFAKVAQATESNVNDLGITAAAAFQNLGIGPKEFELMFAGMHAQAKEGAIELKDMATELSTIAPQWAQFGGGKGLRGARELGAALQIVKRGFGGEAAETVTGLNNFLIAVTKKSARFRDAGVKSFFDVDKKTGKKTLKSVFDIVDLISKSKLADDPERLTKALGSSEAYRAFIQLRDGRKDLQGFVEIAKDGAIIQRDFDTYMMSSSGRMARAMETMKNGIAEAFTPERITAFASAIEGLVRHASMLAEALGKTFGFLGTLQGVGKKIRGAFLGSENGNPFGSRRVTAGGAVVDDEANLGATGMLQDPKTGAFVDRNSARGREILEGAIRRRENRVGYDKAVANIMGGEQNDATTPESIRRAVFARFSGNEGTATAGNRYLANAFSSGEEVAYAVDQVVRKEFATLGQALAAQFGLGNNDRTRELVDVLKVIAENTGKDIKVGSDTVAKASNEAPKHRRAVAK